MRERRSIVERWQQGTAAALVTLVRVEGSSYRRPGARLLVTSNGNTVGAISGGCLETEVAKRARWASGSGAIVERFSTVFDDTTDIPYGLGCGGTLDLLIEPTGTPEAAALLKAMLDSLAGLRRNVVTWLPKGTQLLRRAVYDESGTVLFESPGTSSHDFVFEEWLEPPQRLLLFGAGDDAQPMTQFASLLGWRTIILDGRAHLSRAERFPAVATVIASSELGKIIPQRDDAAVIMTHSYEQDRVWLAAILPHQPRYLGLLGSRHRSALLVSEAAAEVHWTLEQACQNLFAPVGLDLGGDGAEAIALATIAEIQACREGKLGHSRRVTPEFVLEQIAFGNSSRYLQCAR